MKLKDRILKVLEYADLSASAFAKRIGVKTTQAIYDLLSGKTRTLSSDILSKMVSCYPMLSIEWLVAGEGSMLKTEDPAAGQVAGKPYYDVDFVGGFDEVINSQVIVPTSNIVVRGFERADLWCNVIGDSMAPRINPGDIIALRRCTVDDVQYGKIYAVVLDTFRTIKILRRSDNPAYLRFIPINKEHYDEKEWAISRILQIFEVIGSISRFD